MSVGALNWSFNLRLNDMAAKAALHALANHADEDGLCWPSIKRVALFAGCSIPTARRAIHRLEQLGVISVQQRASASSHYRLNYDWTPSQIESPPPYQDDSPPLSECEAPPIKLIGPPCQPDSRIINEPSLNHQGTKNATAVQKHHQSEPDAEAHVSGNGKDRGSGNRKTQLPRTWQPTAEQLFYAEQQGCPDPKATALEFAEYYWSAGTPWMDWNLVFKRWCRNQNKFSRRGERDSKSGLMAVLGALGEE